MARKVVTTGAILPCQSYVVGGHLLSPEQRLMMALLIDALNAYQKGAFSSRSHLQRLYLDAERWFLDEEGSKRNGVTFTMVCDALRIDATHLRRRIFDWKHSFAASRQPSTR
jgi:hypothetical protein